MKTFSLPSILIPSTRNNFTQMRNDNITAKFNTSSSIRDLPSNGHRYSATPSTTATSSYDTPSPYSDHYLSDFPRILTSSPSNAHDGDELLNKLEISGKVPSKDKFRRMACMTFICTGACPYNERCVFLHDSRLRCGHLNGKTRPTRQPTKQNALIKDTFYWPDMLRGTICNQLDPFGLPDVNQMYVIPDSFSLAHSNGPWFEHPFFSESDLTQSRYLHEAHRLPVFALLSCSASFYRKEGVRLADCGRVVGSGRRPPCLSVSPSLDTGFSPLDRDYSRHPPADSRTTMNSMGSGGSSSSESLDGSQSHFGSGLTSKDSISCGSSSNHNHHHHPFYSPMFLSGSMSQDSASMRPPYGNQLLSPPPEINGGGRIRTDAASLSGPGCLSLSPIESVAPSSSWLASSPGPAAFADISASYLQINSPEYGGGGGDGEEGGWSLEKIMSELETLWAPTAEDDAFDTFL
eukprot:gene27127-35849_t